MAPDFETSTILEHRQHLAGMGQLWALHKSQLWAEMGLGLNNTTNAKVQIMDQLWVKYESQQ